MGASPPFLAARRRAEARGESGFVLVAAIWMLGALATLVSIYALYTSQTTLAARVDDDRLQAEASISAALDMTAYRLSRLDAAARPARGAFALRIGPTDIAVDISSEEGRIDLNFASKQMLSGLFVALGSRASDADYYADRIIAWRTPNQEADQEEEAQAYRVAGIGYKPRRGPFQRSEELWLVMGLPAQMVERALPFVTVFSGKGEVDAASAAPMVIAAMPGTTPERSQALLQAPPAGDQGAPPSAAAAARATRVTLALRFDNGRRVRAEVVILIGSADPGDEPYHVLSWHDDFDGPA